MPSILYSKCPHCGISAEGDLQQIENVFGFRKMKSGKTISQSYCRICRKKHLAVSRHK